MMLLLFVPEPWLRIRNLHKFGYCLGWRIQFLSVLDRWVIGTGIQDFDSSGQGLELKSWFLHGSLMNYCSFEGQEINNSFSVPIQIRPSIHGEIYASQNSPKAFSILCHSLKCPHFRCGTTHTGIRFTRFSLSFHPPPLFQNNPPDSQQDVMHIPAKLE